MIWRLLGWYFRENPTLILETLIVTFKNKIVEFNIVIEKGSMFKNLVIKIKLKTEKFEEKKLESTSNNPTQCCNNVLLDM